MDLVGLASFIEDSLLRFCFRLQIKRSWSYGKKNNNFKRLVLRAAMQAFTLDIRGHINRNGKKIWTCDLTGRYNLT